MIVVVSLHIYTLLTRVTIMTKLLGSSAVYDSNKTTLIKRVVAKLDLEVGDVVAFYENDAGDVVIRKG